MRLPAESASLTGLIDVFAAAAISSFSSTAEAGEALIITSKILTMLRENPIVYLTVLCICFFV